MSRAGKSNDMFPCMLPTPSPVFATAMHANDHEYSLMTLLGDALLEGTVAEDEEEVVVDDAPARESSQEAGEVVAKARWYQGVEEMESNTKVPAATTASCKTPPSVEETCTCDVDADADAVVDAGDPLAPEEGADPDEGEPEEWPEWVAFGGCDAVKLIFSSICVDDAVMVKMIFS